jgi:hypothetical protein
VTAGAGEMADPTARPHMIWISFFFRNFRLFPGI